jgi:hypothetical protein
MTDCELLTICPIFERAKNFWISFYGTGSRQEECARRRLKEEGGPRGAARQAAERDAPGGPGVRRPLSS